MTIHGKKEIRRQKKIKIRTNFKRRCRKGVERGLPATMIATQISYDTINNKTQEIQRKRALKLRRKLLFCENEVDHVL